MAISKNLTFKVSVIVPCFNQAQYLDEALQSVLDQTYSNWECIIVNDGSPDNTEEVAEKWCKKDNRFKYIYKENGGLSNARNAGIETSEGEFILPLDADDKIGEDYIKLAVNAFVENTLLKVVYCKAEKFGDESGIWQLPPFSIYDLCLFNMIFCSAVFRKEDWKLVGGYDSNMIYGLEDWEFWIAILKNGGEVKCLDSIQFYYRIKSKSMIKDLDGNKTKYLNEYLSIKHADFFVKQLGSFQSLNLLYKNEQRNNRRKLKSKKFVMDLFCSTFFGFSIFGRYNKNNGI
jgi:glycosyltransferase involved in cell wall biosynthesis